MNFCFFPNVKSQAKVLFIWPKTKNIFLLRDFLREGK